ncbi:MAG: ANTAR domain-containing protein [Acidimicrobiales bacterium]
MHIDENLLERTLGQLAEKDLATRGMAAALAEVTSAMPSLFNVDGAGVLLVDESHVLRYVASTDPSARVLEAAQESLGKGPCVQALLEDEPVETPDVASDERWPELSPLLAPNGIHAILGAPIHLAGAPIGSINVYRGTPHRWDESDRKSLLSFDRVVERLIEAAVLADRNETIAKQLRNALHARVTIERAVGILMAVEQIDAATAFERLRRAARSGRRPVREVASEVSVARRLP